MIKIKCLNENIFFSNCSAFFKPFFFYKQIKNRDGRFFWKTFHPIFFICLYFMGTGGDEDLEKNIFGMA